MPKRRSPLAFTIRIIPLEPGGHEVETSPHHPIIEETVGDVLRGRVSIRTDRRTDITALADRSFPPQATGPIAPAYVRRGFLQLAEVGAEDLRHANNVVVGYLYDAVVSGILGSLHERGLDMGDAPILEIDDGPIPQMRSATHSWWRDVRHVVTARDGGTVVRLRGIPRGEAFSEWGNQRILATFNRRLASALGIPVSSLPARTRLQAV